MTDDLAQELIKAQATERMARDDWYKANAAWNNARENLRQIEFEISKRTFAAAGFVAGSTVFRDTRYKTDQEYLYVGASSRSGSGNRVLVKKKTTTGKWFKNSTELYNVTPADLEILRHE